MQKAGATASAVMKQRGIASIHLERTSRWVVASKAKEVSSKNLSLYLCYNRHPGKRPRLGGRDGWKCYSLL